MMAWTDSAAVSSHSSSGWRSTGNCDLAKAGLTRWRHGRHGQLGLLAAAAAMAVFAIKPLDASWSDHAAHLRGIHLEKCCLRCPPNRKDAMEAGTVWWEGEALRRQSRTGASPWPIPGRR